MSAELIFFFILALGILVSSVLVVAFKNPINGAVSLVCTFVMLAGVYALLSAPFLAIIQVMVYAGAIMVLFLFVIMLLNQSEEELGDRKLTVTKVVAGLGSLALLVGFVSAVLTLQDKAPVEIDQALAGKTLAQAVQQVDPSLSGQDASRVASTQALVDGAFVEDPGYVLKEGQVLEFSTTRFPGLARHARVPHAEDLRRLHLTEQELKEAELKPLSAAQRRDLEARLVTWDKFGSVEQVGSQLYTKWLFPFEIMALLLLAAIPGAVVLAKRRL